MAAGMISPSSGCTQWPGVTRDCKTVRGEQTGPCTGEMDSSEVFTHGPLSYMTGDLDGYLLFGGDILQCSRAESHITGIQS